MSFPVLRNKRNSKINRLSGRPRIDLFSIQNNLSGFLRLRSEDHLSQLCPARADQSAKPEHLTGMNPEIHVLIAIPGYMLQFQNDFSCIDTILSFRIFLCHLPTDHQFDQFVHRCLFCDQCRHILTVADDLDPVAQPEDLFQSVGNVDD